MTDISQIIPESAKNIIDPESSKDLLVLLSKVSSLTDKVLNKPTSIEKAVPLAFKLTNESISDLYYTVKQKLSNDCQDEGCSFSLETHFDDNTHEKYPSLESFLKHHETRPKKGSAVKMTWNATLFFAGEHRDMQKEIGSRHRVVVHFIIPPESLSKSDALMYNFNGSLVEAGSGVVQITISHSNKIWAVETISHIEDFIERVRIKCPKLTTILINKRRGLSAIAEKIIDLSPIVPLVAIAVISQDTQNIRLIPILFSQAMILLVLALTLSHIVRSKLIRSLHSLQAQSAILINEYSKNDFENRKGKKMVTTIVFTLFVLPIILNVVSAYVCKGIIE